MKKLAVVCSGWHFPFHFYSSISQQILPINWSMEMFCISHRDPIYSKIDKENIEFSGNRAYLDLNLYKKIMQSTDFQLLNWNYKAYDNTIGDWGCSNQWLNDHNYNDYDLLLFTHDDNLITSLTWFKEIIESSEKSDWEILSNSCGAPYGWLRGSCEFFKPKLLDKIGGSFDLSIVNLNRIGEISGSTNIDQLSDWNNTVIPLMRYIKDNAIKVVYASDYYRISKYCLEGERGFISKTTNSNTDSENRGLINFNYIS